MGFWRGAVLDNRFMASGQAPKPVRGGFATTRWSLVLGAQAGGTPGSQEALAQLCSLYWYPVFAFVRRRGYTSDEAQDLTQGFFARLIEKGEIASADRALGRFRTFLLTACQHYLANERDRVRAKKRGGGSAPIPIDVASAEQRYVRALATSETPERLFERQWSLAVVSAGLEDVRLKYSTSGRERVFERLRGFLTGDDAGSHADAAKELGMTADAVKVAVHRLRRRYRDALRQRVEDTVGSSQDVDDEVRHLLGALDRSRDPL